jgi:hypothetical protein
MASRRPMVGTSAEEATEFSFERRCSTLLYLIRRDCR